MTTTSTTTSTTTTTMTKSSPRRLRVDIWSDVVCPWCYVGKRRYEAALAAFAHRDQVDTVWHSFELDPSAPRSYEGQGSYAERLARKYGVGVARAEAMIAQMTATAADTGLVFDFARARPGNTLDAHRLLHHAARAGRQGAMKERLLRACFTEGQPIAEPGTLLALAVEVGLDEAPARAVLTSERFTAAVRADELSARELGIRGVPFFVVDREFGVSGAQPSEVLLRVLEQAWARAQSEPDDSDQPDASDPDAADADADAAAASADGASCDVDGCDPTTK